MKALQHRGAILTVSAARIGRAPSLPFDGGREPVAVVEADIPGREKLAQEIRSSEAMAQSRGSELSNAYNRRGIVPRVVAVTTFGKTLSVGKATEL
jgi:hypothetical protein